MTTRRLLVLTDLSERSRGGLQLAGSLSRRLHARVAVGHIHTPSPGARHTGGSSGDEIQTDRGTHASARIRVGRLAEAWLSELNTDSLETVEHRTATSGVRRLIEATHPDLVCMTDHEPLGPEHSSLGSIAEYTLRSARVPVVLSKARGLPDPGQPLRVLVPLGTTGDPARLVRELASLLGRCDIIRLVHAVQPRTYSVATCGPEYRATIPDIPGIGATAIMSLEQGGPIGEVRHVIRDVIVGDPCSTLVDLERKWRPHIVAVRIRGRRGPGGVNFDSVSDYLARRCHAAVLAHPHRN